MEKPVQYSNACQAFLFCLGTCSCSCFGCFPRSFHFSTGKNFLEARNFGAPSIPYLDTNSEVNFLRSKEPPVRQQRLDSICTKCWHYWEGNCSKTNSSTAPCYRNLHFCTSNSNCFPLTRQKNAVIRIQRTFVPTYTWFFSSLLL